MTFRSVSNATWDRLTISKTLQEEEADIPFAFALLVFNEGSHELSRLFCHANLWSVSGPFSSSILYSKTISFQKGSKNSKNQNNLLTKIKTIKFHQKERYLLYHIRNSPEERNL